MLIKIKEWEDIQKTFDSPDTTDSMLFNDGASNGNGPNWRYPMGLFCGMWLKVEKTSYQNPKKAESWCWHKKWIQEIIYGTE